MQKAEDEAAGTSVIARSEEAATKTQAKSKRDGSLDSKTTERRSRQDEALEVAQEERERYERQNKREEDKRRGKAFRESVKKWRTEQEKLKQSIGREI